MTGADALVREAVRRLTDAGVASARADAELLLAHVLGLEPAELHRALLLGHEVGAQREAAYRHLVGERAARVPLQHLTGEAHFRKLTLAVGPGVFVPRPETETLVELALARLTGGGAEVPVVVDLCTGSGAVALALADERPGLAVHAVELSEPAHAWAARNVERLAPDVDLRLGPAQTAFADLLGRVDLVVSNPPYIPPDAEPVDPEVRDHDPQLALYGGGADGLEVPLAVAARAAVLLRRGGWLLMEHADDQGPTLVRRLAGAGSWESVTDHADLTGRDRVVAARRV